MKSKFRQWSGQQFHQYQYNTQLPLTSNHWTEKTTTYGIRNPGLGLGHIQKYGMFKKINGILFYNWISNGNTDINKRQ